MYDYKNIRVETSESGIAVMSFIRPKKLNSWSREVLSDMVDFFWKLRQDTRLKVLVIRGEGDRAFCTGADFGGLFPNEGDRDDVFKSYALQRELRELMRLVHQTPQIVICACHGYTVGGGFFLSMASDIRIISDDVKFSAPLLKLNMSCGDLGCAYMLPRLIGDGVARDLLLTGRYMYAKEAIGLGFASQCVSIDELDYAAMEKAKLLAEYDGDVLRSSKELLNLMEEVDSLDTAIEIENRSQQMVKAFKRQKRGE